MARLKISILVHDLSGNNVVRMYPIAKVLERFCDVEVLGFVRPSGIFLPYKDEFQYKTVPLTLLPKTFQSMKTLLRFIEGDVLYAFKPNPLSFGAGMLSKLSRSLPLVLDIEDYDLAFQYSRGWKSTSRNALMVWDPLSFTYLAATDALASFADQRTVGSTFLQRRYGGTLLPHGADTMVFDPARFNEMETKKKWNVDGRFTILFAGKVTEHKGVNSLLDFVLRENIKNPVTPFLLMVVGGSPSEPVIQKLSSAGGSSFLHIPNQPHRLMPEIISLADLIVLPQKRSPYTMAQVPAKVYEAMAMAKPIIASNVSDLAIILDDTGFVCEAENDQALGEAIHHVYTHPEESKSLGQQARERCVQYYSWDAMELILKNVFLQYMGKQ